MVLADTAKTKVKAQDSWCVSLRVTEVPNRNLTASPDSLSFSLLEGKQVCFHHELDVPEQDWTLPFSDSVQQVRGLGIRVLFDDTCLWDPA